MNFHRNYALRGFFGGDKDNADGGVDLPENARLYYVGEAESDLDCSELFGESSAAEEVTE